MNAKNKLEFFINSMEFFRENIFNIEKLKIFELNLENPIKEIFPQIEFTIRLGSKKDIDSMDLINYRYDFAGIQYSKDRLEKGDKFILAEKDGKIIGYTWVMENLMELSIYNHISLPNKRVYYYKNFVLKEFRRKRVLNAIDNYVINMLRKDKKKYLVTTVAVKNKPAIKARERIGFKRIGKIVHFRFFGLKYDFIPKKDLNYLQNH